MECSPTKSTNIYKEFDVNVQFSSFYFNSTDLFHKMKNDCKWFFKKEFLLFDSNVYIVLFNRKADGTDQSEEDEEQLDHVCVSDGVQTTEESVENGDQGRNDDTDRYVDVDDYSDGGTQCG